MYNNAYKNVPSKNGQNPFLAEEPKKYIQRPASQQQNHSRIRIYQEDQDPDQNRNQHPVEECEHLLMDQYEKNQKTLRRMKYCGFVCIMLLTICFLGIGIFGWILLIKRINIGLTIIVSNDPSNNITMNNYLLS